ncbi:MAG: PD-(D/E)XK nuclease family protein [Desulfonatronovibrionaceae bacterium]
MSFERIDTLKALQLISSKGVMVTATRRLARFWELEFARYNQKQGRTVWPTPRIMPLSAWLEHLFSLLPAGQEEYLLNPVQELFLWEKTIEQTDPHAGLMGLSALAKDCIRALELIKAHQIPEQEIAALDDEQGRIFTTLFEIFINSCARNKFITRACLSDWLSKALPGHSDLVPEKLIVQGFLDFTPQQEHFLNSLSSQGCQIFTVRHSIKPSVICRTGYDSFQAEAEAAARRARAVLEKNPQARVGIIVPELENLRQEILRIFDQVFHPEYTVRILEPENRACNISLGSALISFPLVSAAMNFLKLLSSPAWEIDCLEEFLFSPFFRGADSELQARSALALELRQSSQPWYRPGHILKLASDPGKDCHAPLLANILSSSMDSLKHQADSQSPGSWAGFIFDLLVRAGWPGSRTLNSAEYQACQAFKEELSSLASLEMICARALFSKMQNTLEQLLSRRIFQPETPETPVQILGIRESPGLEFDHLWVMNCSADNFPGPARPNPLLPVQLQARYRIPGASPETRLKLAEQRISMLSASAGRIIFSYTYLDQDRHVLESPLIKNFPQASPGEISGFEPQDIPALFHDPSLLIKTIDDYGLPFTGNRLQGGVRIFQEQAQCPFKGYARHRLKADPLKEPQLDLTALDRGNLVHNALKKFWDEACSSQELQEIKEDNALSGYIQDVCQAALKEWDLREHVLFTEAFQELEHMRLCRILSGWLSLELAREDFEVLAHEKKEEITISGLGLKTRLDRLDRIGPDQLVIIDYKTGSSAYNLKNIWMEDRLLEPQLPIYSLITCQNTAGLALALVHPSLVRFQGIISSNHQNSLGQKLSTPEKFSKQDLQEIITLWREKLENLAGEIIEGLALADPFPPHQDNTCRYCGLMPLCRILSSQLPSAQA